MAKLDFITTGLNGFGRFGLHLLKYSLDREGGSNFDIIFINDPVLTLDDAIEIIRTDPDLDFSRYKVKGKNGRLLISTPVGKKRKIRFTTSLDEEIASIPWLGHPKIIFECSGNHAEFSKECWDYLTGETKLVIISATSFDADKILVYGFNHEDFESSTHNVVSYGSCTVNAYVPLAVFVNDMWGVKESDVHVTHNTQRHKLQKDKMKVLFRKDCTLEKVGPILLDFLDEDNFLVDYIVGPFPNVSAITFRFRLNDVPTSLDEVIKSLKEGIYKGKLCGLYQLDQVDPGNSNVYKETSASAILLRDRIKLLGNNLYMQGYFDNENSVNRFYDLANFITGMI